MEMKTYPYNRNGNCPYCEANNYDETKTEDRNVFQQVRFCQNCDQWSVFNQRNRYQYPLRDPSDKASDPTRILKREE